MNCEGFIYDDSIHYLDHLAPFCSLMGWRLAISDTSIMKKARKFYPDLQLIEKTPWDFFSNPILTCEPRHLIAQSLRDRELKTLWLPHGNSDKGWKAPFFEALKDDEPALVYGQKMIDFFREKKVKSPQIPVGNFRKIYYERYRNFYQKALAELNIPKGKINFLYAPTWEDAENNGSFWSAFPSLAQYLPASCNLLVKWHPNTYLLYAEKIEALIGRYRREKNIIFIEDFPPIYPLLSITDAYIGDMSSIGYDFLFFNRPMFFLNPSGRDSATDQGLYLFRCGIEIRNDEIGSIYSLFEPEMSQFDAIRRKTYDYTFGAPFEPKMIQAACAQLL